jgi:outer membrane lipase/esterase
MIKRRTTMGLAAVALAALLAGCGGGGGGPAIDGFAATGAAMSGAAVTAKCVNGPDLSAVADADGLFRLKLPVHDVLPCMVRAVSADGNTTLHSYASQTGRLNVTPLTELTVSKALGADPATAFDSAGRLDSTEADTIGSGLTNAKASIKAQVETLTGQTIAGDMFTSVFKVGDPDDAVLDKLNEKLTTTGTSLQDIAAGSAQGKPLASRVMVFGDSLSDSGTFGLKFTVQGSAATGAGSSDIWVDRVAGSLQSLRLCPYFSLAGQTFAPKAGCTNHAIGGGRINNYTNPLDPRSIPLQLQVAAQARGSYAATDVLLVTGGGNDAADLAGAWLGAAEPAGVPAFVGLLDSVLGAGAGATLLGDGTKPNAAVVAGMSYMETLAGVLASAIQEHALANGATRVLVMNVPDIALTPRFSAVLYGVTQQAGAQKAAEVKQVIQLWVDTFNASLANRFASNAKVAVLDFNTTFRAQVAAPATFGFTDGTGTACPAVGTDGSGLPTYDFPTCTAAALSAQQGKPSDWWTTYMFSDGFHPTPLAHAKAADQALQILSDRGWN